MNDEKSLATRPGPFPAPRWQEMREQAAVLVKSGFLPKHIDSPEKCLAIMLTGRELGVPPMAAIRGLYVVDGKAVANAQLMLALAHRTGELEQLKVADASDRCSVTVKRRGYDPVTTTWTDEDTKRAGLSGFAWQKYPRVMRRWRAVTEALRLAMPDVLAGVYQPDELGVGYRVEGEDVVIDPAVPTEELAAQPAEVETIPGARADRLFRPPVPINYPGDPDPDAEVEAETVAGDDGDLEAAKVDAMNAIAAAVKSLNREPMAFRKWFEATYGCEPEAANLDQLVDCKDKLDEMVTRKQKTGAAR